MIGAGIVVAAAVMVVALFHEYLFQYPNGALRDDGYFDAHIADNLIDIGGLVVARNDATLLAERAPADTAYHYTNFPLYQLRRFERGMGDPGHPGAFAR